MRELFPKNPGQTQESPRCQTVVRLDLATRSELEVWAGKQDLGREEAIERLVIFALAAVRRGDDVWALLRNRRADN